MGTLLLCIGNGFAVHVEYIAVLQSDLLSRCSARTKQKNPEWSTHRLLTNQLLYVDHCSEALETLPTFLAVARLTMNNQFCGGGLALCWQQGPCLANCEATDLSIELVGLLQ